MDNRIRIQSHQGQFPTVGNSNVDLIIPEDSGVYDFTKTYIAIGTSITNRNLNMNNYEDPDPTIAPDDVGIFDIRIGLTHGRGSIYNTSASPVECLVKNCSIRSSKKGMLDSIRHSDTLRGSLGAYTRSIDSMIGNSLTGIAGPCKDVPWVRGNYIAISRDGRVSSTEKTHEIRIMLSDLFNIGNVKAWDSAKYGSTYIHLEMNFDRIELTQVLGPLDPTWTAAYQNRTLASGQPDLVDYGYATVNTDSLLNQVGNYYPNNYTIQKVVNGQQYLGGSDEGIDQLVMKCPYDSLEDVPFYVGMELVYEVSVDYGPDPATQDQGYGCKISFPAKDPTVGIEIGLPEGAIVQTSLVRGSTGDDHLVNYDWLSGGTGYKFGDLISWKDFEGTPMFAYANVTEIDTSAGFPLSNRVDENGFGVGVQFQNLGLGFVVGEEYNLAEDPAGGGTGGKIRCDTIGLEGRLNKFIIVDQGTTYDIGNTGQVLDGAGKDMGAVYVVSELQDPNGPIKSLQFRDPGFDFIVEDDYEAFNLDGGGGVVRR